MSLWAVLLAALGALGGAVEIGFKTRALLQIAAGVVMVVLAADLLGGSGPTGRPQAPPAAWAGSFAGAAATASAWSFSPWRPARHSPARGHGRLRAGHDSALRRARLRRPAVGRGVAMDASGTQRIAITVRPGSYSPSRLSARPGVPTDLVLHSVRATGCTSDIVFPSLGIERTLPVDGETVIPVGALRSGRHPFTCAMGMYGGTIEMAE